MKGVRGLVLGVLFLTLTVLASAAQTAAPGQQSVPRQIPVTGTLVGADGQPVTGPLALTFAIYTDQEGGAPLWVEVQQVVLDERGRFSAWLGVNGDGLPPELFVSGEARWLGIEAAGLADTPRTRFLSVPYALKAGDAETLGGMPASAFLLANAQRPAAGPGSSADLLLGSQAAALAAPDRDGDAAAADIVHNDDVIITTSLCVGFDCATDGSESFGFDTIRLKENNVRIKFDDTSTLAGFSNNDWQLTANDSASGGASYFSIDDVTGSKTPFRVDAGAPSAALYITSSGRVGLGTNTPSLRLQTTYGDTPGVRLEQTSSFGWTAQSWDLAGNESNFFVRDVTNGSKLPFRIQPNTPSSTLTLKSTGNVGIGTWSPEQRLHVDGVSSTYAKLSSSSGNAGLVFTSAGGSAFFSANSSDGALVIENPVGTERMRVMPDGKVGIGTAAPTQVFEVYGPASQYATLTSAAGNAGFVLAAGASVGVVRENVADGSLAFENPNGTERMRITSGGYVGIGTAAPAYPLHMASGAHVTAGGVWTNASSRALKDRIAPLTLQDAETALASLQPVTYVYKADPADPQVGFIAEDVPALVATNDRSSLSPMDIVAVAVKVIQEQRRQLDAQQARQAELESRVAQLEQLLLSLTRQPQR